METVWIETPIGVMKAIANNDALLLLEFSDKVGEKKTVSPILCSLIDELVLYFKGTLKVFKTPLFFEWGTTFQRRVWSELAKIPYGQTRSYAQIAEGVGKPKAYRAAAQANGANPFTILIPCHRVINSDGRIGGYSSGLERKKWLLAHEK